MCILTFMHAGVTADINKLRNGAINNPDGFGFAIHAGTKVIRHNGMNFEQVLERFLKERSVHSGPALFHSRITTHGGTNVHNCHPFQIGRDQHSVIAHNGMLPIPEHGGRSDTRILAEDLLPSWGGVTSFDGRKFTKKISKFAQGSKLVVITANPNTKQDYYIINEQDGHWENDVWWSNGSYKYARYSYGSGSMYTTGWNAVDTCDDDIEPSSMTVMDDGNTVYWYKDENGFEYPVEYWECQTCKHIEMVTDDMYDDMMFCDVCDTCWYCGDDKVLCMCRHNGNYDVSAYTNSKNYYF